MAARSASHLVLLISKHAIWVSRATNYCSQWAGGDEKAVSLCPFQITTRFATGRDACTRRLYGNALKADGSSKKTL